MNIKKVFICRPIPEIAEEMLKKAGIQVEKNPLDKILSPDELKKKVAGMDAVLSLLSDKITAEVLASAGSQLKIVANYAVGVDNIDIRACQAQGVMVTNTTDVLTEAVAEHVLALTLAVTRRVVEADRFTRRGEFKQWMPLGFIGPSLFGKTMGIIGMGRIGSLTGEMAHSGFKMKVIYFDLKRDKEFERKTGARFASIAKLLKNADVVSLNVPLTPKTKHLISSQEFKQMKQTATLINTSRGPVVDEKALVSALKSKEIWGAGLDVFEEEPKVNPELIKMDNVVLTPHIASATSEARDAMAEVAAKNIIAVLGGKKPLNQVC